MSTASITSDEVLSILNDLLENSRDGEYGFRACADEVEDAQIKQVFANRSAQCAAAAAELATLIRSLGGEADKGGSVSGALFRAQPAFVQGTPARHDRPAGRHTDHNNKPAFDKPYSRRHSPTTRLSCLGHCPKRILTLKHVPGPAH